MQLACQLWQWSQAVSKLACPLIPANRHSWKETCCICCMIKKGKKVPWLHCSALRLELALWTEDFRTFLRCLTREPNWERSSKTISRLLACHIRRASKHLCVLCVLCTTCAQLAHNLEDSSKEPGNFGDPLNLGQYDIDMRPVLKVESTEHCLQYPWRMQPFLTSTCSAITSIRIIQWDSVWFLGARAKCSASMFSASSRIRSCLAIPFLVNTN